MDEQASILSPKAKRLIIFWSRMVGWLVMSCIIPIVTFSVKFGLFNKEKIVTDSLGNVIESSSTSLNGWGLVACVIVGYTASTVLKEVIAAYPQYSLAKQWLTGFTKTVLPLLVGFFICLFINGVIQHIMFCLGTLAVCQFIAIPLNPLPKWRYEKAGVENYSTALDYLTEAVKRKKEKAEKGDSNG